MKVLYIGSKGMGYLALKEFIKQKIDIVGVVARWDDPYAKQWYPSVTELAKENKLICYNPKQINDPDFIKTVKQLKPDIMFTAFYPKIYKKELLQIPKYGSINLHFAPLPRYRGSYPGAWAIINGEKTHGVTIHYMKPGVDNGDIIAQKMVPITNMDTGKTLYEKCEQAGVALLQEKLQDIINNRITAIPQRESDVLYNDRNYPYGGVINFGWTAEQVYNYVRALTFPPFPNPFSFYKTKKFTVQTTFLVEDDTLNSVPGQVIEITEKKLLIQCTKGIVGISDVLDNKNKQITMAQFYEEYEISSHSILGR